MQVGSPEVLAQHVPRVFTQRIPLCEIVSPAEITDRLELTQQENPVDGIKHPLLDSIRNSHWFSIERGRIYIEVRNPYTFKPENLRSIKAIKGVDYDDCLMSATRWHGTEFKMLEQFGVSVSVAHNFYDMSKIKVPGRVIGEPRYTPRFNLALLTAHIDLLRRDVPEDEAFNEITLWRGSLLRLLEENGEIAIDRQAINPKVFDMFIGNPTANFIYRDFAKAVFNPRGDPALRFIATRGKIEGPLGQVYKVHTSGIMRRNVDMVIYTNDIKAETLIFLSRLITDQKLKQKKIVLYDDNPDEVIPYLQKAKDSGMENIWVVQVSHPDVKRRHAGLGIEPFANIGRESQGETVLRYYPTKQHASLSEIPVFQI